MKKVPGLIALLGAVLMLPATGALAQYDDEGGSDGGVDRDIDRRAYVAPMLSYTAGDSDRLTDDGYGAAISIGKRMTSGLNLELTGFFSQYDLGTPNPDGEDKMDLTGVGLGAMVFLSKDVPGLFGILALHHGAAQNQPTTPASAQFNYDTVVFDSGLGYLLPLADYLGGTDAQLRLEARYRMDQHTRKAAGVGNKKSFYEGVVNIGVLIPLGSLPVEETFEPVSIVVPPADSDNDGIPDDMDQCPDTPFGTAVDGSGCEEVADADGDGVDDSLDACPDSPVGMPVDEQGCTLPADADGDGVPDDMDQCPDTPAGTAVTGTGCAEPTGCREPAPGEPISLEGCATGEAIALRGVTFELNEARLTSNAKVILNGVADSLLAAPNLQIEIGGHTDSQGSDAYNQKLSERRAQAVVDYFESRGVPAERMSAVGYGEAEPVDTNETAEGRENNRRVEIKIIGQ